MSSIRSRVLAALAEIERLHPAPMLLSRAVALLQDPDSQSEDLAELIGSDAALTADTIRFCNTAFYGLPQQVSSLAEALQFLGYNEVFRLVGLNVARAIMGPPLKSYGLDRDACWAEGILGALLVAGLAPALDLFPPVAFTAGLLLPIGRLAINEALNAAGVRLADERGTPLEVLEIRYAGLSHPEAGALLLERWQFTPELCDAVRQQSQEPHGDAHPLVIAAQTTRWLLPRDVPEPDEFPEPLRQRLEAAGVRWNDLLAIRSHAEERRAALRASLTR